MGSKIFIFIIVQLLAIVSSQRLCNFSDTVKTNTASFIQHFSTSKCMRITAFGFSPNSKVVLDECSYWNKASDDQKLTFTNSTLGKLMIRNNAGQGDTFCLTTKQDNLYNDYCQPMNFDQNWTLNPVRNQKGQFTIEQYSSKKCLIPKSRSTGAVIQLAPCNAAQTEQIWKICL